MSDFDFGQVIIVLMLWFIVWLVGVQLEGLFNDVLKFEGWVVCISIYKGELVLEFKLVFEGIKVGLDFVIKKGYCVIIVKVNEVVGVVGFLVLGSYVDLLVNIKDDCDMVILWVVLECIMVLVVVQEVWCLEEIKVCVVNVVMLEVIFEQVEKIDLVCNVGFLLLMLCNQVDMQDNVMVGVICKDFFGDVVLVVSFLVVVVVVKKLVLVCCVVMLCLFVFCVLVEFINMVELICGIQKFLFQF